MSFVCDTCGRRYARNYKHCPHCHAQRHHYEPSADEIAAACEAIRARWPLSRLRQQEGWQELEVAVARQVTDHMVRRDGESEARK